MLRYRITKTAAGWKVQKRTCLPWWRAMGVFGTRESAIDWVAKDVRPLRNFRLQILDVQATTTKNETWQ